MKLVRYSLILTTLFVAVGCGPSRFEQLQNAKDNQDACLSELQTDQELKLASDFLTNNNPTSTMLTDERYPTLADRKIMARWIPVDVSCSRELIYEGIKISGLTRDPYWNKLVTIQSQKEDLYLRLIESQISYGDYFMARQKIYEDAAKIMRDRSETPGRVQRSSDSSPANQEKMALARAALWDQEFNEILQSLSQSVNECVSEELTKEHSCITWHNEKLEEPLSH